jgi:hypothetical protein
MIHIMLPTQYLRRAGSHESEPYKRLMAAVLQTVVDDCRGSVYRRARNYGKPPGRRGVSKASAYMASRDRSWPFSFENLCDALGMDADLLRKELQTPGGGRTITTKRAVLQSTSNAATGNLAVS